MIRIAINGFGRIGRGVLKAGFDRDDVEFVAVNDLSSTETLAYLLKYDSVYGRYKHEVKHEDGALIVNGKKIVALQEKDPAKLPWKDLDIDVVIESTGFFVKEEDASKHVQAGAKRVVISAPSKGNINTYIIGVNDKKHGANETIVDNGSCTTNCSAPVAAIMHGSYGIKKAMMTTIHAYTKGQNIVDASHKKDPRRGRSAAINIVPTTTGAAKATVKVIPDLEGLFDGIAVRVPVPVGSLVDFTFVLGKKATVEEINDTFRKAAENPIFSHVLQVTEDPIVSTDIIGNPYSAIVDLGMTRVVDGDLVKVIAWYDNEWAYSQRLIEMVVEAGKKIGK